MDINFSKSLELAKINTLQKFKSILIPSLNRKHYALKLTVTCVVYLHILPNNGAKSLFMLLSTGVMFTSLLLSLCVLCVLQWIPLLEDGELKTGAYNLCVSAEKPPSAYSQLKTDVRMMSL